MVSAFAWGAPAVSDAPQEPLGAIGRSRTARAVFFMLTQEGVSQKGDRSKSA
ncbi:MAG: hypothetical protein KME30_31895 [Iphinoe sp. HA4291-MV1]|nr:hypothetical protein [Iphinoe sp. HA4291-MV1]